MVIFDALGPQYYTMPLYALDEIDDAFRVTREFLTPFDLRTWLKLALVVFFVGGVGANAGGFQFNVPVGEETPFPTDQFPELGAEVWLLAAGLAAFAILLTLVFLVVGSIMEFVLVESLRTEEVHVRRYWSARWRQGLRLFGFRLVVGLVIVAGVAALLAPLILGGMSGDVSGGAIGVFLVLLPLFIVLSIALALVNGFTTSFVVPIMILTDVGILAGWRRLWPTIRAEWDQYLVYAVAQLVLTVVAGIALAMVGVAAALVLLIPFGLLALVGFGLLALTAPIVGAAVLAVIAVLYGLTLAIVLAVAQVPVVSYLRYYALLVLGDVDEGLDLIPTQRAAARKPDAGTAA
jgi:hypothetical protein